MEVDTVKQHKNILQSSSSSFMHQFRNISFYRSRDIDQQQSASIPTEHFPLNLFSMIATS